MVWREVDPLFTAPSLPTLTSSRHQSGSVLLVAMLLILISALLGVSVMEQSNLESRLVVSDQARESAFRAAEASAGDVLTTANISLLTAGKASDIEVPVSVDSRISTEVEADVIDVSPVYNSSIGQFQNFMVTARAIGTAGDGAIRRVIILGAAQRAPAQ